MRQRCQPSASAGRRASAGVRHPGRGRRGPLARGAAVAYGERPARGIAGVLGFALGSWGVRGLLLLAPGNIPRLTDPDGVHAVIPALDWRVAAFTIGVALLTGVIFGLYPALTPPTRIWPLP